MKAFIRKNMQPAALGKLSGLLLGSLLCGAGTRVGAALTLEQHMLSVVSDHYYLTFFMLPLVLLIIFPLMEEDGASVLVRFSSYYAYFCARWLVAGLTALLILLAQTAGIVLSAAGLPSGNVWTLPPVNTNAELFSALQGCFKGPLQACMAYTVFQFAGIWFLAGLCMWIGHFAGRKGAAKILMFLYAETVLWMKIPVLQEIPATGLNHLLIFHHNLANGSRPVITAVTVVLLLTVMLFTVRRLWHLHFNIAVPRLGGLFSYYMKELAGRKNMLILWAAVLGMVLCKGLKNPYLENGEEWIVFLFGGHGTGCFQMLAFLELLIVNGAALYLLAVFVEKSVSGCSLFLQVRAGGRKDILKEILNSGICFLLLYCLAWGAGGGAGAYFLGYTLGGNAGKYLIGSIVLKFFDLLLQYMVMLAVYLYTKQITAGFLAVIAGNLLCIIPWPGAAYLPFGLSGLSRIAWVNSDTGISVFLASFILAALTLLMLLWLLKFGYRKLLN